MKTCIYKRYAALVLSVILSISFAASAMAAPEPSDSGALSITLSSMLSNLDIELKSDDRIYLASAKSNILQTGYEVFSSSKIVIESSNERGEITETLVDLYTDELTPAEFSIIAPANENKMSYSNARSSTQFYDQTTEFPACTDVYGNPDYRYAIVTSITYTSYSTSSSLATAFYPQSYYIRASAYDSATYAIDKLNVRIFLHGYEVLRSSGQLGDFTGYFESEQTYTNPTSAQTYSYSCAADFNSEYSSHYVGVLNNNTPEVSAFGIYYMVTFDEGSQMENTNYIAS